MINRIVSFFILCLVLCIPLCVAYFHSGELMMRFVFFWPFFMSIMWIVGGVYFWVYRERHWPWGENAPAPQLKDNPSISIIIPCFNEEKNVEETIHAALAQRYENIEVIAVNDGSTDKNGCEYMTGGIVCILGKTGVNFGAGMTGGFAYVLDESGDFRKRVNPELVEVLSVDDLAIHEEHLRGLITEHVQHTGSQRGEEILANWSTFATKFALVKPKSSDVKALLGHRSRSAAELRVQAQ